MVQGAAPGRHRGDPGRGLQPHGRRRRAGPTFCFGGLTTAAYYMLDTADQATYRNYTGCGNTLNGNHPVVRA